jgi:hypothetical protein
MSGNRTAASPPVTAAEWFAGGRRIPYDPESARVLAGEEVAATPGALRVFERVAAAGHGADAPPLPGSAGQGPDRRDGGLGL